MPIVGTPSAGPTSGGFTIGRAGRTLFLNNPSMWAESQGQITVTVMVQLPAADALVLRDQLLGYVDNLDESIVPVIVSTEPRLTGYYHVTGVQIDTDPVAVSLGFFAASVSLERVQGFTQPLLESVITGARLTNGVGATGVDVHAFHAVPASATEYSHDVTVTGAGITTTLSTRASADGNIGFLDTGSNFPTNARFGLAPANFYVGGATFEQGNPLQPVVGRMLAQADLLNWRLSNGLVRVTPNVSAGKLDISHHNGTSWSTAKTYSISATPLYPDRDSETITTTSAVSLGLVALASFKAATTIARVGALGTLATGAVNTVSPTFGQATVAGHLLVAWASCNGATGPTTAAAGWVQANFVSSTGAVAIWYKPNCGAGEAAPTFTSTGAVGIWAQLAEFSGVATASPVDLTSTGINFTGSGPVFTDNLNVDVAPSDLILTATRWVIAPAATATFAAIYSNGAVTNAGNTGASSITGHSNFSYQIVATAPATITGVNSLVLLRNSVEETSIRLSLATSSGVNVGILTLDISLRRGDRLARLYLSSSIVAMLFKLARNSVEAATAITYDAVTLGGIRATANDGDGNRYVLLSYQRASPVNDLVNGAITQGAPGLSADYAIGSEVGGSAAVAGLDDAVSLSQQYLAAQGESQRIVTR